MRKLATHIETELKAQDVCAVYNSELARVWPKTISPEKRKEEIKRFADEHRLAVTFYDIGLCAIFERPDRASGEPKVTLRVSKPRPRRRKRSRSS